MLATPIARLRVIGLIESLSSFALFFIAMPIKYIDALGANPQPVSIVGAIHGGLFVLFILALLHTIYTVGLPKATIALALLSSLLPFPFEPIVLDPRLRARQKQLATQPTASPQAGA